MTDHAHIKLENTTLAGKKGDGNTKEFPLPKAGYRPLSVQCMNLIKGSKILTMVLEAVM